MRAQLQLTGVVLNRQESGEGMLHLDLFSPEEGLIRCFKRQRTSAKRGPQSSVPDLFDTAEASLEGGPPGGWFITQYTVVERRDGLGCRYQTLRAATFFATLVAKNLDHAELREPIYDLVERTLSAFARTKRDDLVLLKALYLFARDEGYAVQEQFAAGLLPTDRRQLQHLLRTPVEEQDVPSSEVAPLLDALESWMQRDTDILVPKR